jgi:hypothetical protein
VGSCEELCCMLLSCPGLMFQPDLLSWTGMGDYAESDYSNEWDDDDIDPDNMTYEVR